MTDPLDDLKRAMDAATPAPNPARKADTLTRAQEIHDRAQERPPTRVLHLTARSGRGLKE